jgi:hypothetical protein
MSNHHHLDPAHQQVHQKQNEHDWHFLLELGKNLLIIILNEIESFGSSRVCSDSATGIHYGIATCEGCKVSKSLFYKYRID